MSGIIMGGVSLRGVGLNLFRAALGGALGCDFMSATQTIVRITIHLEVHGTY